MTVSIAKYREIVVLSGMLNSLFYWEKKTDHQAIYRICLKFQTFDIQTSAFAMAANDPIEKLLMRLGPQSVTKSKWNEADWTEVESKRRKVFVIANAVTIHWWSNGNNCYCRRKIQLFDDVANVESDNELKFEVKWSFISSRRFDGTHGGNIR